MKTTALVVEYVVVGSACCIWLILVGLYFSGHEFAELLLKSTEYKGLTVVAVAPLLGVVYSIGFLNRDRTVFQLASKGKMVIFFYLCHE